MNTAAVRTAAFAAPIFIGGLCFAFRTTDGVGPYHTSGCLVGDRILGQTWAEHRKFVLNWSAARE